MVAQGRALARGEDGPVDRGPFRLAAFPPAFHPNAARVRAVHLFLAQRRPLNPANGKPVEAPLQKGMAGARMWPSFTGGTQSQRTPPSMASRVLVGLGPGALKQALDRLECQPFRDAVLRSHCIPVAAWEAWLRGDKERFLALRKEEIVREELAFAEAMGVEVPKEVEVDDEPEMDVEEDGPSAFG